MREKSLPPICPSVDTMIQLIMAGDLAGASKLIKPVRRYQLATKLLDYGCIMFGHGEYSIVFQVPGQDTVIKLNHARCDQWVHYAQYAKSKHSVNPMLPVIHEFYQNAENGMGIARCEVLEKVWIEESWGMGNVVRALSSDLRRFKLSKRGIRNKTINYMQKWFDLGYKGDYSRFNLAKIVIWIAELRNRDFDVQADFHGGNWMKRGNELVLIDPIA